METARTLFDRKGYESTSVDDIVNHMGVAKGLFYYYFDSKEALLSLLTDRLIEEMQEAVRGAVRKGNVGAMERLELLMRASVAIKIRSAAVVDFFHEPRNKLLHFEIEQRGFQFLVPALESIIKQGTREGIFHAEHPHEIALAFLGASSAIGHENVQNATKRETMRRVRALQSIAESLLGCRPGSFKLYEGLAREYYDIVFKTRSMRTRRSRR